MMASRCNDLVSYNQKHNEANGEDNRDGTDNNRSWNCGVEGPTDDPAINALRAQQKRNFLATLLLSQGVPMLLAGDEIGHTQQRQQQRLLPGQRDQLDRLGRHRRQDKELIALVRKLIALRKNHPVFRRRNFFQGRAIKGAGSKISSGFRPDGREMTDEEWNQEYARSLGVFLSGEAVDEVDERGQPVTDENFLLLMNAHHEEVPFSLPPSPRAMAWMSLDRHFLQNAHAVPDAHYEAGDHYPLQPRSLAVLVERQRRPDSPGSPA